MKSHTGALDSEGLNPLAAAFGCRTTFARKAPKYHLARDFPAEGVCASVQVHVRARACG